MEQPTDLIPLIDGDILRYEVGFGAVTGWTSMKGDKDAIPPFDYVEKLLLSRIKSIQDTVETEAPPIIYITEGTTFRFEIAKTKIYKGTRKSNKPWHFDNITAYMKGVLDCEVVTHLEADDAMALKQCSDPAKYIICSRDKDLRQVPGWGFSWEIGNQPSFGPEWVPQEGRVELHENKKKLVATGLASFYGQLLTGDTTDNIPGLKGCGPVAAYSILTETPPDQWGKEVRELYEDDEYLLEQGRLLWMTRKLHEDGKPVLWEIGMEE